MSNSNLPVTQEPQTPLAPALAREFGLQLPPEQQAAFDAYDERNLQASWGAALETDPGMRAEAEMHARALGQPVESVAENMDIARKMVKERQLQYRELRDRYPALLDRFSDVKFASVAHDDIGNLKLVEGSFDWLKRSWNAGRAQNEYGWIGTRRMLGMDSREDRIRAAVIEKRGILDGGDGWAESVVKTFSQMAGSMANSLGAGAAAGVAATAAGPYAPVASPVAFTWATGAAFITQAAAVEGGSHYNELRRQGYSHETSQVSGLGVGLINGALEAVGAKIAAAPFKAAYRNVFLKNAEAAIVKGLAERTAGAAVAGFGREYLKVLAAETATETMQEFVTMAGERIARERERPDQSPMTWAEIGTRTGDVFVQTVQAMSVLGLPGPGAQFISDSMRANQAMRGKELLEKLAKGANASELAKRSPDRFRQFVAKAAEGTDAQEMFIEPEQLRAVLEQTGVTEEQLGALVPDVVAQLEQADADGGPVSIPTDLFAAKLAKTDIGAAMIPHVKFTQTGFTVSQGEKFQADAPKMAEQASAEYEKLKADMDAVKESVREVESGLRAQLLATGKFDKRSADAAASYYGSFVALQAARAKMLPSEFAAKYPLSVVRGEAPAGAVVRQFAGISAESGVDRDAYNSASKRLEAGESPDQVRKDTGWFRGADGKMRFEIDDSQASLKPLLPERSPSPFGETLAFGRKRKAGWTFENQDVQPQDLFLGDVLDHPSLFKAYPRLADVLVEGTSGSGAHLSLNGEWPTIRISDSMPMQKVIPSLLHEIQHWIQEHEGFASGGSPTTVTKQEMVQVAVSLAKERMRLVGEARDAVRDGTALPEVWGIRTKFDVTDSFRFVEFQNSVKWTEQFLESAESAPDGPEAFDLAQAANLLDPYQTYRRLHGEVEARNAAERGTMTAEQRSATGPHLTADTPAGDTIVKGRFGRKDPLLTGDVLRQTGTTKTDSPEFRAWFGDSKVVDEKGAPLVVYHGTDEVVRPKGTIGKDASGKRTYRASSPELGFSEFRMPRDGYEMGAHFGSEKQAKKFGPAFQFFLSISNPLRLPDLGVWGYQSVIREARKAGVPISEGEYDAVFAAQDNNAALRDLLTEKGFDGIVYANAMEGRGDSYIAFRPEQIKSVNNSGTFDPTNPNILKQTGMAKTDSPEFKAWFQGSRVVNETGAPLVVYHGSKSPTEDFAFDFSKIGTNGRAEGAGFYFTTDEKVASGYASDGTLLRTYLSIKKPMALSQKGFTATQLRKILMRAAEMESAAEGTDIRDGFLANYGDTYTSVAGAVSQAAKLIASDNRAVDQMGGMVGGGLSAEYVNRSVVEVTGFDGVVSDGFGGEGKGGGTIYVAFLPEQIKSVNNRGTFDPADPNILKQTTKGTFDPASFTVTLTADADSSTVLHEFGHAFLTMMADLASQQDAPAETVADVQTVLDWFGVKDVATWNAMSLAEQTPHHEAFARSFEVYLFDGKAPSEEMEGIFRRFAKWVRAAYRNIRDSVNAAYRAEFGRDLPFLTPEVRGVFDRMVASEDAIAQAEALRSMQPMFATEEEFTKANPDAGPSGWTEYQAAVAEAHEMAVMDHTRASLRQMKWLTGAKSRLLKALQREGKAAREKVEADEMRKASEEKVYAAMERIRYGEMDDNGERSIPLKLNLTEFRQNPLGDETREKRFGTGKNGLLAANGLPLDTVAQVVGYTSGEELVRAMVASRPIEEVVAERTDARMIEEHGNLVPGSDEMEAAITEALHNEARARFVATEWRHLAKAGQPINQVRRQLRASASRQLAAMATGRISPHQFALAEANAARESMRASKAGKFDDALLWKRKQLMQGELAKQATKVRAEIDKAREDWKRFAAADSKVAETRNIDIVNAGRVLGAAYGLTKQPETAQQATIWRQAIVDTAKNHQVIGGQLQGLLADGVAPWKDVPLERFRDVAEMGSALWDLARRVNEVEANGRKVALQEASAELRAQVGTLPERAKSTKAPGGETPSGPTRWILRGWNAVASLKRMEHWARFMDGGKDGPFMAYLVQPVMRALQRYRDAKAGIIAEMHPRLMALAKASGKAWDANIDAPELGKGHTFRGIKEVVGAMMHTGSDSNRFKLLGDKVRQWCPVYDDPETGGKFVDTKNWDAFIGRMHQEGRITKEHWDYVNFVWSTYAKVLPEAQKTHKALYGREFETIELRPVETPFGTYPGGYVPATTDRDEVSQPRPAESIEGIAGMEQNFEWSVSTGKGFTIERNPNYAQPLVLNVARQLIGIDSELRFIHLQPTIRDVLRLSRERQFADVLSAYDRDAANAIITPWLENTATQASSRPSDIPLVDTLASLLRRGTSLAALGLNFFNALIQVTGISNARGEVKGRYMRSALGLWFKGPAKAYQDAAARSDYFRQRMDAKTKVMAQDIARMGDPGFVPGLKVTRDKLGNAAFFPQRLMQGIADTVTWHAAYAQAFAEGKSNVLATSEQMEAYAVEQADSVLRRVQGSQNPEDLAAYEAGTPLAKLFTQFGSYSNTVLNQLMGAQKGGRARIALWALVMPAMIEATLRAFLSGKVDKDDDDKYLDDLALLYGKSLLRNATGLIPGAGPLVLSLGESEGSRLSATPAGTTLQSAVQGMFAAANVAAGEDLTSYQIRNLGTLLTILSGLPLSPISRALGYAQDVEDGKAEPSGPIDYGRGLVTGQR